MDIFGSLKNLINNINDTFHSKYIVNNNNNYMIDHFEISEEFQSLNDEFIETIITRDIDIKKIVSPYGKLTTNDIIQNLYKEKNNKKIVIITKDEAKTSINTQQEFEKSIDKFISILRTYDGEIIRCIIYKLKIFKTFSINRLYMKEFAMKKFYFNLVLKKQQDKLKFDGEYQIISFCFGWNSWKTLENILPSTLGYYHDVNYSQLVCKFDI